MLRLVLFVFIAFLPLDSAWPADTLKGVALVIGNGDYASLPKLSNPANDARAVEELLNDLGFDTTVRDDRDLDTLRRDLERFVEDAEHADVAVFYYSGHGIEAGGENFLVPVDADPSALDDANGKLAPLSAIIARLQATVPVTIVLLDACRTNPFPTGAMLKLSGDTAPVAIATSGLGETRGVVTLAGKTADGRDNLGTVIGFAAAPGQAALDGTPGGNSPYAAAVLKHLDAMSGYDFGLVMRMVAEEVYLRTDGRQRPWMSESLRRLLYFGKAPAGPTGEEGAILSERRQLLITIADLPDIKRSRVQAIAAERGVPMDALYGMLKQLGANTPDDPAEIDRLLREQTEQLKEMIADRAALTDPDAEIQRLTRLADEAVAQGALQTAVAINQRAKARLLELAPTLEKAEADLKARFVEAAAVYARSGRTFELTFEFSKAAQDYEQAFRQVERWDDELAWTYLNAQTQALARAGIFGGDSASLERSVAVATETLALAERFPSRAHWAETQNALGVALARLGELETGSSNLERAVAAFRASLSERTRQGDPLQWAVTQHNLGATLYTLAVREASIDRLHEAEEALRLALLERTKDRSPLDWAATSGSLANVLFTLAERDGRRDRFEEAERIYRDVLLIQTEQNDPYGWAGTQHNLANTLSLLADGDSDSKRLEEAVVLFHNALRQRSRGRTPLAWAMTQSNLCATLRNLGYRRDDPARINEAVTACREALKEQSRKRSPVDWAMTEGNLGNVLSWLGGREEGTVRLEEAVEAYRAALLVFSPGETPGFWAMAQENLGETLATLGARTTGTEHYTAAAAAFEAALRIHKRDRDANSWANLQVRLGDMLKSAGEREQGSSSLEAAIEAYGQALLVLTFEKTPRRRASVQKSRAGALEQLGVRTADPRHLDDAVEAYRNALKVLSPARDLADWPQAQWAFANLLLSTGENRAGVERLTEAVAAFELLRSKYPRDRQPLWWAGLGNSAGYARLKVAQRTGDAQGLAGAVAILREATAVQREIGDANGLAGSEDSLCEALFELGKTRGDRALAEEAIAACDRALAAQHAQKLETLVPGTTQRRGNAVELLGSLDAKAEAPGDN